MDGKTGILGDNIKVTRDKTKVTVTAETTLSKRCAFLNEADRALDECCLPCCLPLLPVQLLIPAADAAIALPMQLPQVLD